MKHKDMSAAFDHDDELSNEQRARYVHTEHLEAARGTMKKKKSTNRGVALGAFKPSDWFFCHD